MPLRLRILGAPALAGALLYPAAPSPFAALEARCGGRLGVVAVDTGTGRTLAWRGRERFLMCSTFKLLLVAQVLHRVDAGEERLDRVVPYGRSDLIPWAPVCERHLAEGGLTVEALCEAAIEQSDNTAANLLLAASGGPRALTAYARSLGDRTTRLDRTEPALNRRSGLRDTTTPEAMAATVRRVVLGTALSGASRERLGAWLLANATGGARIRAGVPAGWRVEDKTGTGERGATNDIGVLLPPGRAPIVLVVYTYGSSRPRAEVEGALAGAARIVAGLLP